MRYTCGVTCRLCDAPLPAQSSHNRRYCSVLCRNRANAALAQARPVEEHGTGTAYARGCRCAACRDYIKTYARERRAKQPPKPRKVRSDKGAVRFRKRPQHGTASCYSYHGCRCDDCTAATRVYNAAWREANPERYRSNMIRYRRRNPDRVRGYDPRRGAAAYDADALDYCDILAGDPCCYCGKLGQAIDHILPLASGGDSRWDNLTRACTSCNSRKGPKSLLHFLMIRAI